MSRMWTLRSCWCLFFAIVAGSAGVAWGAGGWQWITSLFPGSPPIIEYPNLIDLGDRTVYESVDSQFQIVNRGGQELVIHEVKTSCACGRLHREFDGRSEVIDELHLAPGERAAMLIHSIVLAKSAGTFNQTISFLTNDPTHREGRITILYRTPSGGLRFHPNAVHFGRLLIGTKTRQVVDVLDRDALPQTVSRVFSTDPERVAVRWLPAHNKERRDGDILLGQVEVVPNTAGPMFFEVAVQIEFADPKIQAILIQVSGRVTSNVEVTPESVVLPLSSSKGRVYSRKCVIRMADERPWHLEIDSVSPGLKVALPDSPKGAVHIVEIAWTPSAADGPGAIQKLVHLTAKAGEASESIKIPVTCEHQ